MPNAYICTAGVYEVSYFLEQSFKVQHLSLGSLGLFRKLVNTALQNTTETGLRPLDSVFVRPYVFQTQ